MTLQLRKIGQLKNPGRIKLRFISSIKGPRLKSLILRIFMFWQGFFFSKVVRPSVEIQNKSRSKMHFIDILGSKFQIVQPQDFEVLDFAINRQVNKSYYISFKFGKFGNINKRVRRQRSTKAVIISLILVYMK